MKNHKLNGGKLKKNKTAEMKTLIYIYLMLTMISDSKTKLYF